MNERQFGKGLIHENLALVKFLKNIPRYVFVDDKTRDRQKALKMKTWIQLGKKCCIDVCDQMLGRMKVGARDGKIVVISGEKDMVTRSAEKFCLSNIEKLRERQHNISVKVVPDSPHAGPFLEPERYIEEISEILDQDT